MLSSSLEPIFLFWFSSMLLVIYWLPGGPENSKSLILTRYMYTSKLAFSIMISMVFEIFIIFLGELVLAAKLRNIQNKHK
jgi:hypothetical protein